MATDLVPYLSFDGRAQHSMDGQLWEAELTVSLT